MPSYLPPEGRLKFTATFSPVEDVLAGGGGMLDDFDVVEDVAGAGVDEVVVVVELVDAGFDEDVDDVDAELDDAELDVALAGLEEDDVELLAGALLDEEDAGLDDDVDELAVVDDAGLLVAALDPDEALLGCEEDVVDVVLDEGDEDELADGADTAGAGVGVVAVDPSVGGASGGTVPEVAVVPSASGNGGTSTGFVGSPTV